MPLNRVKANELLELVVIDQSPKARELLLDKLEECVTPLNDPIIRVGLRLASRDGRLSLADQRYALDMVHQLEAVSIT